MPIGLHHMAYVRDHNANRYKGLRDCHILIRPPQNWLTGNVSGAGALAKRLKPTAWPRWKSPRILRSRILISEAGNLVCRDAQGSARPCRCGRAAGVAGLCHGFPSRCSCGAVNPCLCMARKNGKSAICSVLALGYLCGPLNVAGWRGAVASLSVLKANELRRQCRGHRRFASNLQGLRFVRSPQPGKIEGQARRGSGCFDCRSERWRGVRFRFDPGR